MNRFNENDILLFKRYKLLTDIYLFSRFFFYELNRAKWVRGSEVPEDDYFNIIASKLNAILDGTHPTNHLILNIPPRHGKTEMAMINFAALGFAINPESEFMHFSSSDALITRNVQNIRRIMECETYKAIFPNVELANNAKGSIQTTRGGVMYAAPFLGQITGFGCGKLGSKEFAGAMLIDDPIKTQDALSETIREKVNFTWANTLISRKNDQRTPVIVTAQRVHEHDFCGFLIEGEGTIEEGGKWDVVKLPAIVDEGQPTERALWEFRLSLEKLKEQQKLDGWVFDTQYMQNPKPIEGLMFPVQSLRYYDVLPEDPVLIFCNIGPADRGKDKTCSVIFKVKNGDVFVEDIIYTEDNTEITIPRILEQINTFRPAYVNVESNGAWMLFARDLRTRINELNINCFVRCFNQNQNKEIRIFNNAPSIVKIMKFKKQQEGEYFKAMKDFNSYLKLIKDQKDDFVDVIAAACEWLKNQKIIDVI